MSLISRDKACIWHPFSPLQGAADPIAIVRGKGALLFDENGRSYIDAISSWWVNLHGHAHPYISEAIAKILPKLHHVIFAGFTHEPAIALAEKLLSILPAGQQRIFYSDDGSTAVEVALKMCVQYWHNLGTPRRRFLALEHGYHGDTFGAMSVGAQSDFTAPFSPLLFDVTHFAVEDTSKLEEALKVGDVAGFIFEPLLQGAGGMRIYSAQALNAALTLCKRHGVPTIADEVLTGFGRSGRLFASNYLDHLPDIMCLSKGLTGGTLPLGVTSCSEKITSAFSDPAKQKMFLHGHSYTANPIACTAAFASMELLENPQTQANIARITEQHSKFVQQLVLDGIAKHPRSLGTVAALEFPSSGTHSYYNQLRDKLYNFFLSEGVLLRPLGNTVYILPPYCITSDELNRVYQVVFKALKEVSE